MAGAQPTGANEPERPIYASEESMLLYRSVADRLRSLERTVSDHAQRFDTLQTPWWKRLAFWLDGWPWHDLNAPRRAWRPWHGRR